MGCNWILIIVSLAVQFCVALSKGTERSKTCQVNFENNLVPPCVNCEAFRNNTQHIKGYEDVDVFPSVVGCFVNGVLIDDTKALEETHVIFIQNNSTQKIFLTLKKATLPQISSKFDLVLLSLKPVEWRVLLDGEIHCRYFVSDESSVILQNSGEKVPTETAGFSTSTNSGRPYHAAQIKRKVCTITLQTVEPNCKEITSFVQVQFVNCLELVVAKRNNSLPATSRCDLLPLQKLDDKSRVKAVFLSPKSPVEACADKIATATKYLFAVDVYNYTSNANIRLELNGLSNLMNDEAVYIVLRSNQPVHWRPFDASDRDISVAITFVVSNGSVVDAGGLSFSEDRGGVHVKSYPHMLSAGETLLDTTRKIYNISTTSYAKFINQPSHVKLLFLNYDVMEFWGPPQKIPETLIILFQMEMLVTDWGSRLQIAKTVMQNFGFGASEVILGDGTCTYRQDEDHVIFEDLAKCGLHRISFDAFNIEITVKKRSGILRYVFPRKAAKLRIKELHTETEVSYPQHMNGRINTYFVQVSGAEHAKYGVYTQLDQCYLIDINSSDTLMLINNHRPAKRFVRLYAPHQDIPATRYKTFLLTLDPQTNLKPSHLYNLTCSLSRCFSPKKNAPLSNLLPECLDHFSTPEKITETNFTDVVSVNAFMWDFLPEQHSSTPVYNGTRWVQMPESSEKTSESSFYLNSLMYILSSIVGFVLGALFLFVACNCLHKKFPSTASEKLNKYGMPEGENVSVELMDYKDRPVNGDISKNLKMVNDPETEAPDVNEKTLIQFSYISSSPSTCTPNSDTSATDQTSLILSSPASTDRESEDSVKNKYLSTTLQVTT